MDVVYIQRFRVLSHSQAMIYGVLKFVILGVMIISFTLLKFVQFFHSRKIQLASHGPKLF